MLEGENKMEPSKIAGKLFDKVMDYCENERRSNGWHTELLECVPRYEPDELPNFINSYLTNEDNEIKEAIQNADQNFLESVKKEYEKLWTEEITRELRDYLGDTLESLLEVIVQDDELCDACKIRRLKAYDKVLDEFGNAILQALQNGKPLSLDELDDWYMKIGDAVYGIRNYDYYYEMGYYDNTYDLLDDNAKLEVLSGLLDYINSVLWDIEEKYLPELEALTNNNS